MKYYSEKLDKLFDTEEEVKKAEQEHEKREKAKKKKEEERERRAKEVNDAYSHYLELLNAYLKDYSDPDLQQLVDYIFSVIKDFKV